MKQYEIWWAALPEPSGHRPVMLLSRNLASRYLRRLVVVEITSRAYVIPQEVRLGPREGLQTGSVARFDNLMTVPIAALRRKLGQLARGREIEVKQAMGYMLGWPELVRVGSA